MKPSNIQEIKISEQNSFSVIGELGSFAISFEQISDCEGVQVYRLQLESDQPAVLKPIVLQWTFPAIDVKGIWTTNALHEKRLRADWESPSVESRVSVDAPIVTLFSHRDENVQTFACADVINTIQMEAPVREEDNLIYCQMKFFTEQMPLTDHYETEIRIDTRAIHFGVALQDTSEWWASFDNLTPLETFEAAKLPLYSTWYSYHQSITVEGLLSECRSAAKMGYKLIIVDDGWQTKDGNRGYDYTGDWLPERIPDMAGFVKQVHGLGMKFMVWYSVPFCGVKSKAYQRFKGKLLVEEHRWAPVFDPRYPDVREYLIGIYTSALRDWNIDGFKLDFIDEFRVYPGTVLTKENGRDYASVNEAVDRLMTDVMASLREIKPDILIEFRQKYIGPAMRKYGNMFRAFDCPNDSLTNRVRTTDVKLLCGSTAVHSDMFTWHRDESVEIAALQILNILFSVPQLSVRIAEQSEDHKKMIRFYTEYWLDNREVLLDGHFVPSSPLSNYPLLCSAFEDKAIYGIYENLNVNIDSDFDQIDLINGKMNREISIQLQSDLGHCKASIYDCMGHLIDEFEAHFDVGIHMIEVPASGLIALEKLKNDSF